MPIEFLRERFRAARDEPALVWQEAELSYGSLLDRLDRWGDELARRDVAPGSVVAIEADFSPNAVALLLALIEAWQLDEGDHPASRGCRSLEQYARRVPQLAGDVAALVEKSMDTYTYSIRAKVRKSFGFTPEARALSFAVVENVRGEGFRAGLLLREAQLCERNTEERRPA